MDNNLPDKVVSPELALFSVKMCVGSIMNNNYTVGTPK
jgi:hypothetical protein